MELIKCISFVHSLKNAKDLAEELESLKIDNETTFIVRHHMKNQYCVLGKVTSQDWETLNLDSDFMSLDDNQW